MGDEPGKLVDHAVLRKLSRRGSAAQAHRRGLRGAPRTRIRKLSILLVIYGCSSDSMLIKSRWLRWRRRWRARCSTPATARPACTAYLLGIILRLIQLRRIPAGARDPLIFGVREGLRAQQVVGRRHPGLGHCYPRPLTAHACVDTAHAPARLFRCPQSHASATGPLSSPPASRST